MTTELMPQQAPRRSLLAAMASKYDMDPGAFQQVIAKTVMPAGASNEQMAAFLLVANTYDLNPVTREIYAFPAKGGGITPVVGVDGWINLAQRRPEFDGVDFEFATGADGKVESCTAIVYRNDRGRPVRVTEYMAECARPTDPWRSHPRRMLRHKALIQAIRLAFGFAGIKDEDDADIINHSNSHLVTVTQVADPSVHVPMSAALAAPDQPAQSTADPIETQAQGQDQDQDQGQDQGEEEWPKMSDTLGVLVDVQGCPWIEQVHSIGKTCNDDGYWRRKRGVLPSLARDAETAALAKIKGETPAPESAPIPTPATASDAAPPSSIQATTHVQDDFSLKPQTEADARFDNYRRILTGSKDFAAIKSIMRDIGSDDEMTESQRDSLLNLGADMLAALEE